MKRERPASVLVLAILQIVFGSLCFMLTTCGGVAQFAGGNKMFKPAQAQGAPKDDPEEKLEKLMEQKVPAYKAVQVAQLGLGILLSVALLVSGIGLLKLRPLQRLAPRSFAGRTGRLRRRRLGTRGGPLTRVHSFTITPLACMCIIFAASTAMRIAAVSGETPRT
jgi:hypothetical protein